MRVLVLSCVEWDDRNAFGNTVSNFFGGWPDDEFASIYGRSSMPSNTVCKAYYRITVKSLVRFFFHPQKIGYSFTLNENRPKESDSEKKTISKIQHSPLYSFIRLCADVLYGSVKWQNERLSDFITNFNPDIVFLFCIGDTFLLNNVSFIKKHTSAKVVTFIADDVRGAYKHAGLFNRRRLKNFDKLIQLSDKVYGATEELAREYSSLYSITIDPLYKGCSFMPIVDKSHNICEILYAGNLHYGRVEVLSKLAEAISICNATTAQKCHLSIYSNTIISDNERKLLDWPIVSSLYSAVPYKEVMELMNKASIVLHVESFQQDQIEKVRLSFSTKIIDCMQSGSVLMVVGPNGVSSVEYAKRIPGVITITSLNNLRTGLADVLSEIDTLKERALSIRNYSMSHHNIDDNRNKLRNDFSKLIGCERMP